MTFTYEQIHAERYRISEDYLKPILAERVLEVGAPDGFSARLKSLFKIVDNTAFDLRYPAGWRKFDRESYDLVVCMELVEHINEPLRGASTVDEVAKFTCDGVRNTLDGINRVLKSGGILFLTTPNGASVENVRRALNGHTPIQYMPHVREYGPRELAAFLEESGFEIIQLDFHSCYLKFTPQAEMEERNAIKAVLGGRWPAILRGETTFVVARKKKSLTAVPVSA